VWRSIASSETGLLATATGLLRGLNKIDPILDRKRAKHSLYQDAKLNEL
jgi:hypothetical protein